MDFVQTKNFLTIESPLGENALLLSSVQGTETISTPFCYAVEFYSTLAEDKILSLLGKPVTLFMRWGTEEDAGQPVNGLVRKVSGPSPGTRNYQIWRAEIVPQLAFLAYTRDCRMFQSKTVVQIVTDILNLHGVQKFEFRNLMGTYPTLDYCVQYRESALNFIARLMEHYGIYYWFEHTDGAHNLVIADTSRAAKPVMGESLVMPDQDMMAPIHSLETDYTFRPGKWTLKDYDFVNPDSPLKSSTPTVVTKVPMASYEIFDFPGSYEEASHGEDLSRIRVEQEETQFHQLRGRGTVTAFHPGYIATIAVPDDNQGHQDTKYFITSVDHHASDPTVVDGKGSAIYGNSFMVVPTSYTFRPPRRSRKPFVQGPQTAKVTGPAGEKIYTDNHGRVKVRFHWDRNPDGDPDEQSSCWLRVSQIWSSGVGGGIQVPRIGEEVIVDFLEGDPDRPIITGRVYNGNNGTPYGLPGNQTQFGFKTQSIPSGGFHELRFEDKAGSEEIYFKSQKDFNRKILNDETDNIGGNATRAITGNLDHTTTGTESRTISKTFTKTVVGAETRNNNNNVTHTIAGTHTKLTTGAESHTSSTSMTILSPLQISTINEMIENAPTSKMANSPYVISTIGANIGAYGEADSVTGQAVQVFGVNSQLCGVNNQVNLVDCSTNVVETKETVAKLESVASHIKTAAMEVKTHAMNVKNTIMMLIS